MTHAFHWYLIFWVQNTFVALFLHGMVSLFVIAAVQTMREDSRNRLYHPRVYRDENHARMETEDAE